MLPDPSLSFTLPSLQDGIAIDCRIYHPPSLSPSLNSLPWRRHAAVVAHPYAPLGGCYDDPVVDVLAVTLLRVGFLVGTFNFRGAPGSAGRTTWTAGAERRDYMTVVGFMAYYVHYLDPFGTSDSPVKEPLGTGVDRPVVNPGGKTPSPQNWAFDMTMSLQTGRAGMAPVMLLGGYSYGAMVTAQLPPFGTILASFDTPLCGSAAAETRMRAQHLAEMQNAVLRSARPAAITHSQILRSPRKSSGLRVGGDEEVRRSHDARRSFLLYPEDNIRRGVTEWMSMAWKERRRKDVVGYSGAFSLSEGISTGAGIQVEQQLLHVPDLTPFRVAYLLVSPLQGLVTNLATMSFPVPFWLKRRKLLAILPSGAGKNREGKMDKHADNHYELLLSEDDEKLVQHPTLAVYGEQDVFVAAKRLREWASRLTHIPHSRFHACAVPTAGHFWTEDGVLNVMRDAVRIFAEETMLGEVSVVQGRGSSNSARA